MTKKIVPAASAAILCAALLAAGTDARAAVGQDDTTDLTTPMNQILGLVKTQVSTSKIAAVKENAEMKAAAAQASTDKPKTAAPKSATALDSGAGLKKTAADKTAAKDGTFRVADDCWEQTINGQTEECCSEPGEYGEPNYNYCY